MNWEIKTKLIEIFFSESIFESNCYVIKATAAKKSVAIENRRVIEIQIVFSLNLRLFFPLKFFWDHLPFIRKLSPFIWQDRMQAKKNCVLHRQIEKL